MIRRSMFPLFLGATLLGAPLVAQSAAPVTQLVQSIPAETDLADPALPFAKDAWVDMIRKAVVSIDAAEFYVTNRPGSALEPVLAELEKAGARGVKVRFLLSAKMLENDPISVARLRRIPGAQVHSFDLADVSKGILHAKYFLVDEKEAFIGSQNFDWRALEHIHELGVRTAEPVILSRLARLFAIDWAFAADGKLPVFPGLPGMSAHSQVELVASPPFLTPKDIRPSIDALVDLIGQARQSIRVQLLTYSPIAGQDGFWPVLDNALRAAAVRGVKVRLMVSDWVLGSRALPHLKALRLIPNLEVKVVSVPEAKEGHIPFARTIHSKYLVVDDTHLALGTSNWEESYFSGSRNVELIFRDSPLAAQATRIHDRLWDSRYAFVLDPAKVYEKRKVD
ncbi:phospholipase D-like domain-containing protein [Geothrix sp. PMB-07]|uniref:phospholipase D-like domain-containing protein n=1 Tax=Geothrix sp. PMB-07 TaxID=3068640 RepID=UPI002740DE03|nr:phospholipase D-like domain-containing protein [Geothrix sp. PMB-07]WLT33226.1 phospholipase D-like domain-containing protein [Geothrix sp. PMB-07]